MKACHRFLQMTAATQWMVEQASLAYRSGSKSPYASIWQSSSQSDVASGTCLGRTPSRLCGGVLTASTLRDQAIQRPCLCGVGFVCQQRLDLIQKGFQQHVRTRQVMVYERRKPVGLPNRFRSWSSKPPMRRCTSGDCHCLRQHCVGGPELCGGVKAYSLFFHKLSQRPVARHRLCSSACDDVLNQPRSPKRSGRSAYTAR